MSICHRASAYLCFEWEYGGSHRYLTFENACETIDLVLGRFSKMPCSCDIRCTITVNRPMENTRAKVENDQ